MIEVPVLVVGGGPVGLAVACELGLRGTGCILAEQRPGINEHPRANVVASRTMEHFHRWGIADRVARAGLPLDYPVDIVFTTRLARREIFRFSFPSYEDCRSPSAAKLSQLPDLLQSRYFKTSVAQSDLEPVLLDFARSFDAVDVRFGWRLDDFTQDDDGVTARLTQSVTEESLLVRCRYLVACDGGRSEVRARLGVSLDGEADLGQFVGVHFRSPDFMRRHALGRATLYWAMNRESPGVFIAINGRDTFTFQRSVAPGESVSSIRPLAAIQAAFDEPIECEILSVQPWKAHQLVAERLRIGRVFIAGDAAHLFVPTGGFGMNTGIGDAVDLGWKLAAVIDGWGGAALLDSYHAERHPVAVRNTTEAADNYRKIRPAFARAQDAEAPDPLGASARSEIARGIAEGAKHFAATGIHLGYRYESSPVCIPDATPSPPDDPQVYVPTSRPGSRAPHVMLDDGRSILDLFGAGFTLIRTGEGDADHDEALFVNAGRELGIPVSFQALGDAQVARLYERRFVLVRPDGHVAWRGDQPPVDVAALLRRVAGHDEAGATPPNPETAL